MYKDAKSVWGDIVSALKNQLSQSTFKTWFSGSDAYELKQVEGKTILVVGVKNSFVKEQLDHKYREMIVKTQNDLGFLDLEILFIVLQKQTTPLATTSGPLFSGKTQSFIQSRTNATNINRNNTFLTFVVGPSNNLAYVASKAVIANLGSMYNPLLLWGASGTGKTHLLQAIGNEIEDNVTGARVLYVTSEKFTNDYLESLQNKTQAAFRQKYRKLDVLLVDDIQFLAGKESTQDEFFHTFNEVVLSGGQVVIVSDRHPKELGKLKERLVSRFLGGMVADLGVPDTETKMAIIKLKCRSLNLDLSSDVVEFVAKETRGGVRELEGLLTTIAAFGKAGISKAITVDDIKPRVVAIGSRKNISPEQVIEEVCKHYKIRKETLCGNTRRASVVSARQVVMYFLRKDFGLSLEQIGSYLGNRDHSTVIYGVQKIEDLMQHNNLLRDEVLRFREVINS